MVLSQCLQVFRTNQRKIAVSLAHEREGKVGLVDTRDVKQTLTIVPFRHSKLSEILMDYLAGDGYVLSLKFFLMIVNVNPYKTRYDENLHAVLFVALAREVDFAVPEPEEEGEEKEGEEEEEEEEEEDSPTLADAPFDEIEYLRLQVILYLQFVG
ncbi:hypothetical protein GYMLUDRAFT_64565 [Collybiopsis luxurians FD-317 M1]|uniref:Kinesin motor domain-containing protein n=1 Tax=Collybiopsis luxurians FD-317 M1 TaxID=944289 RepID=A0A0D0C218_9AGAR|nr:hypothetical protein GYMLUDRAFT_64565 [Collybiopsis luxurians FD-317 M1]